MSPFDQLSSSLACHNLQPQNEKRVDELLIPLIVIATLIELLQVQLSFKVRSASPESTAEWHTLSQPDFTSTKFASKLHVLGLLR